MEQKHINVIRTCLKIMRAFGNDQSKSDIGETLKAFDKAVRPQAIEVDKNMLGTCPGCGAILTQFHVNYCYNCGQRLKFVER